MGGVELFHNLFAKFFANVDKSLFSEYAFNTLYSESTNVFNDAPTFLYRAQYYKDHDHIDVFKIIQQAASYKSIGDYINAGANYGNVIYNLYYTPGPKEDLTIL
eukprot:TRINITY_DN8855_c0_g1_i8.p2 TRINITY_DN8855_c0_g1~~TRINITY_DN8855_c0_g1_i8.p2  ORF type:complete len:104 (+),score=25.21 TRINITY_DN8855_c0_g1_i8:94-405(+)